MAREEGYSAGLEPALQLFRLGKELGIPEITFYGFTTDNTRRPARQRKAFTQACVRAVELLSREDAALLVVGNTSSPMFPKELLAFSTRQIFGKGTTKINFLVNYGWEWDLSNLKQTGPAKKNIIHCLHSAGVSKVDLIIRWGGRRRLSGFLPVQSIYADFYIVDEYWPDFTAEQLYEAFQWYNRQDITLGG